MMSLVSTELYKQIDMNLTAIIAPVMKEAIVMTAKMDMSYFMANASTDLFPVVKSEDQTTGPVAICASNQEMEAMNCITIAMVMHYKPGHHAQLITVTFVAG